VVNVFPRPLRPTVAAAHLAPLHKYVTPLMDHLIAAVVETAVMMALRAWRAMEVMANVIINAPIMIVQGITPTQVAKRVVTTLVTTPVLRKLMVVN